MRHTFLIPYIIMFSIWLFPAMTTASVSFQASQSNKMEWNNFSIHSILQKRDSSHGYRPRVDGNLEAVKDIALKDLTGIKVGGHLFLPWTTIVGAVDIDSLLDKDKNLCGQELNVIIGDLNQFPVYIQIGRVDTIIGRHVSALLPTSNLMTRTFFTKMADGNRFSPGAKMGGHYIFNGYGTVKAVGFWCANQAEESDAGLSFQYDIIYSDITFLIGGGRSALNNGSSAACNINNIYTEVSVREESFNNPIKFKFELMWANAINSSDFSSRVLHTELSYHLLDNTSAVIVGYSSLQGCSNSLRAASGYWLFGVQVNFSQYWDIQIGIQYGKSNDDITTNEDVAMKMHPLLRLKLSI